jgi:hypothetical protein
VLAGHYMNLPLVARTWISGIARDAQKAGRPITLFGTPTARRYEIVRGLVTLAAAGYDEDEIVRALIAYTIGIEAPAFPTVPVGIPISTFTADEARRFADLAAAYVAGTVTTTIDNDGRLVFNQTETSE